jgi:hypothetical protein
VWISAIAGSLGQALSFGGDDQSFFAMVFTSGFALGAFAFALFLALFARAPVLGLRFSP